MKHKKAHVALFSAVVFAVALLAALAARTGYGQSQSKNDNAALLVEGNHLQPTAVVRERRAAAPATAEESTAFTAAAGRNSALRYELSWAFGGKQQRGWYLYVPLISRTIETEN